MCHSSEDDVTAPKDLGQKMDERNVVRALSLLRSQQAANLGRSLRHHPEAATCSTDL
jgi:hypothetical protein